MRGAAVSHRLPKPGVTLTVALAVMLIAAWVPQAAGQDRSDSWGESASSTFDQPAFDAPVDAWERPLPGSGIDPERVVGPPRGAPLQGPELDRATRELAVVMRCVACQGLSVADSPAPAALAMKAEIRELLAAGYTASQTLDYFEGAYGEFIRLVPKARGFNLVVWIVPVLGLLAGLTLLARRLSRHAQRPAGGDGEDLETYRARVRKELSP